jgi:sulfoxide reductase catalytic subunit YedY
MNSTLEFGFPMWIRLTHSFNFVFMALLIRSGIEILGAHPKLYWSEDALLGTECLKFTKKKMPKDRLWTAEDGN